MYVCVCVCPQDVAKKTNLGSNAMKFFALFERMEHDFGEFGACCYVSCSCLVGHAELAM